MHSKTDSLVDGSDVHGREVDGAFLVDSFSQMVTESGSWDYYMSRMLLDLWQRTGRVFMAVCAGGSALTTPCSGGIPTPSPCPRRLPRERGACA